jgi:hypothetical protein
MVVLWFSFQYSPEQEQTTQSLVFTDLPIPTPSLNKTSAPSQIPAKLIEQNNSQVKPDKVVVDVVCPEGGFVAFAPHPRDCSLYDMCNGGFSLLMGCHSGLYFDLTHNVCNYPQYVDCKKKEIKTGLSADTDSES